MYNVTALYNTTDYGNYLSILNTESQGILGITILSVIALVFLITFYREGFGTALTVSGLITSISAIIMFGLGFLPPYLIVYPVLMFAAGLIGKKLGGGD